MSGYPSVEQQSVTSNDGKPTSSDDGRTVYIKTQVHPHHREEIDQVLSCYPWNWSKAEEMIGLTCNVQTLRSKAKTKNLIIDNDNNYLKIVARGTTTVPAQFILEGNSSRQEVKKFKNLSPETNKFFDELHKSLRVLAVETKVQFNGQCDIKKYGKNFNKVTMEQKIAEDKTPDAQLASLHCLYTHILTLNDWDGRQIEDKILLQIIIAMKNLKSDIVCSTQKWLRTLVLKYFMFVQRYYSFGKFKKGDSYSTVNTYDRLLVLSKDDLYGCYMVVACINHVKDKLNFHPDVKEQLFRKYTMSGRELEATEDNLFFQTFWEECYKDAMKKLIKTPQEIHRKKHEKKLLSEKLKLQSVDVLPTNLNSKPPALELGLAQLEEQLAQLGGTYEEACKRGRDNYRSQHGCDLTNEPCFEAGEVAGDKFMHYKKAYERKKLTQTDQTMTQKVVATNQEEAATNPTTAAAQAKENNNDGDDSVVDPKAIDNGLGGGARVLLSSSSSPSKVFVDHLSKEGKEDEEQSSSSSAEQSSSSSAKAKKKTKVADDLSLSVDLSYSAEEQKQIDDSINEVMKRERENRPKDHEHTRSHAYSMKRVCSYNENKKGCWGTVLHEDYTSPVNDRWWTVHFDDNTVQYWTASEINEGLDLYEINETKDPSGNHKKKSSSSPPSTVIVDHLLKEGEDDEVDDTDNSTLISTRLPSQKKKAPKKKTTNKSDPLKKTNCVVQNNSRSSNEPKEKISTVGSDKFCKRLHKIGDDERECAYDDMKPLDQKHYYKKFQIDYSTCSISGVKCLLKDPATKFKSNPECDSLKQNFGQYLKDSKDSGTNDKGLFLLLVKRFETVTCAGSNRIFGEVENSKLHTKLKYCQLCIHPRLNDNAPRVNPSAACMPCIEDLQERRNEKERGVITDSSAKKRKRRPVRIQPPRKN